MYKVKIQGKKQGKKKKRGKIPIFFFFNFKF